MASPNDQRDSGWRPANASASWRTPDDAPARPAPSGTWRVPGSVRPTDATPAAAPTATEPESAGGWHLPDEDAAPLPPTDAPADDAVLPFDGDAPAEAAVAQAAAPEPDIVEMRDEDDEDDDGGLSMAELVAMASLAAQEQRPTPGASGDRVSYSTADTDDDGFVSRPLATAPATAIPFGGAAPAAEAAPEAEAPAAEAEPAGEEAPAGEDAASLDPGEYARRQLEQLEQAARAAGTESDAAPPPDPGSYAREQMEFISSGGEPPPRLSDTQPPSDTSGSLPIAAPALTTQEQALVRRYEEVEASMRDLRAQYQNGQISRDQLTEQMRQFMVLDDDRVYWAMGFESDRWYRVENGQWVEATPPVLDKARRQQRGRIEMGSPSSSVPRVETPSQAGQPTPTQFAEGYSSPLPRPAPINDPEATIASPSVYGFGQGPTVVSSPAEPTLVSPAAGATIINPSVTDIDAEVIQSPRPADYGAAVVPPPDERVESFEEAQRRQQARTVRSVLIAAAIFIGALLLLGACGVVFGLTQYSNILEPYRGAVSGLASYQPQFQTARILAADGTTIAELTSNSGGARTRVELEDMSPYIIHAIIAVEDERFYQNPGFDLISIGRALIQNVTAGEVESGASTITQQIARNLILQDTTVSPERKLQEIVIASQIGQEYTKNEILELYLNEIYFGNLAYGVEAAAQFYFGIPASELNLPQAALLAGLIQAPATFDPVQNREGAMLRMNEVLDRQATVGCLQFQHEPYLNAPFCVSPSDLTSPQTAVQKAQVEVAQYQPRRFRYRYPHFISYVQQLIERDFGSDELFRRGFQIRTTIDPRIQNAAQTALETQLRTLAPNGINNGAVMVSDPTTGAILAMIGSVDFNDETIDGQVNNVFTWQQPGSAIKPVEYTAALEGINDGNTRRWLTPASILWDVPTTYNTTPPYSPVNFSGQFYGPVTLRNALQNSLNVASVKVFQFVGVDRFRDTANRMGLNFLPEAQFGLPSALGANEVRLYDMVNAYGTLANNGVRVPTFGIVSITDSEGRAVELPERTQQQQIQPQVAFLMQDILSDNDSRGLVFGPNTGLAFAEYPRAVAAKTGTTDGNRDLWTMGFTRNLVVGVWLGRNDNEQTFNTSGLAAVPVWNNTLRAAFAANGRGPSPFAPPEGITQAQICVNSGTQYDPNVSLNCGSVRTEYVVSAQPPLPANTAFVQNVQIDTWSGLRANNFCPNYIETRPFVVIDDPAAIQWLTSAAGQQTARNFGLPTPPIGVPANECSATTQQPIVQIASPIDGSSGLQGQVQITGTVSTALNELDRYQIEVAPTGTTNYVVVSGPSNTQVGNGILGTWNTQGFPNGTYTIRLAVFRPGGGFIYRTLQQVTLINPTPTPPPTNTPAPTPTLLVPTFALPSTISPNFTPLPFDTPIPNLPPTAFGAPTPTYTPEF